MRHKAAGTQGEAALRRLSEHDETRSTIWEKADLMRESAERLKALGQRPCGADVTEEILG